MLLIALSFIAAVLLLGSGVAIGYHLLHWRTVFNDLQDSIAARRNPEPKQEGTGAVIVDPEDIVQRTQYEREEMSRRINGE